MKKLYLVLAAAGFLLPYIFIVQMMATPGPELLRQFNALFAGPIALLIMTDLLISVIGFWCFAYCEARRIHMRFWWIAIVATLTVGLCFAIPIYLYFRESQLEQIAPDN